MTTQVVYRLSAEVFAKLEKSFRPLVVTENTSQLQAGRALGIQEVLNAVRAGLVIERTDG